MKKKILLLFAVLATAINALAYDFQEGGIYYNILSLQDLTCEVTSPMMDNLRYSNDIIIPSSVVYDGKTFSVIGIGEFAFYGCTDLTSVTIANSVIYIGEQAFDICSSLTSIEIPNSVTTIGNYAFSECFSLITVDIGNSVDNIGKCAFNNCPNLTSFTGKFASDDNRSLILNGVLVGVAPAGLTDFIIPNSVTEIPEEAFYYYDNLNSVKIPDSVTEIGVKAFQNCSGLASVEIGNSVTVIEHEAFFYCTSLTSVAIPNSVNKIGYDAFAECPLTDVYASWDNPGGKNIHENAFTEVYKTTLHVPYGTTDNYKFRTPWNNFKEIVEYVPVDDDDDEADTNRCAEPTIEIFNHELVFTSATPGATFYTSITSDDIMVVDGVDTIELSGVYNITSYAHADGYRNSKTVKATLIWIMPDDESLNVLSKEAKKAVLMRVQDGDILVSGTERGETIQIYTIDGLLYCTISADEYQTVIPCNLNKGEVIIVSYGGKSVKIVL